MATYLKTGLTLSLPIEIIDDNFDTISAIEFVFTQTENGEALKTAYFSRDDDCRDAMLVEGTQIINIKFSREDTYLFQQDEEFFCDTRITRYGTDENPVTPILRLRMNRSLFKSGVEVTA